MTQRRPAMRLPRVRISGAALALGVASAALATLAGVNAVANVTRTRSPTVALALPFGGDPTAGTAWVSGLITTEPKAIERPEVRTRLIAALRHAPLDPAAVRNLGLLVDFQQGPDRAVPLLTLAERLSRRDTLTQLWLIEQASRSGDVRKTLRHYDLALRTEISVQAVLFGTLAGAMSEPEVARELVPLVRARPNWLYAFVADTAEKGTNLATLERVISQAGGLPRTEEFDALQSRLVQRLVDLGSFDAARRLLGTMTREADEMGRTAGFTRASTDPRFAPFSWQMFSNADTGTAFEAADGGALVSRVIANAPVQATVLRRLFNLQPGTYRFSSKAGWVDAGGKARLSWSLRCGGNKEATLRWTENVSELRIPAGCTNQLVELDVWGEDDADGAQLVLSDVRITPA